MITLIFPFRLISKDNEKISNRQGRFFLSKKFKDWEDKVRVTVAGQYPHKKLLEGDISLLVTVYFTNKVHSDTTNLFKGLCDALQGAVYINDRQIKEASIVVEENFPQDSFQVVIQTL